MKKYIRSRIFMTIKACIAIIIIFFIGKENYENKSLSVSMNTNLNKSIDKQIIQDSQNELYKEGIYNPLYTFTGELTGYAGDCPLCSGYLALYLSIRYLLPSIDSLKALICSTLL